MVLDYALKMGDLFSGACSYMGGMATTQIDTLDFGLNLQQVRELGVLSFCRLIFGIPILIEPHTRSKHARRGIGYIEEEGWRDAAVEEEKLQHIVQWPQSQRIPTYFKW